MIIVTGGAGFIGSGIIWKLNRKNSDDILVVDELGNDEKWKNLSGLRFHDFIHKNEFIEGIRRELKFDAEAVIHMGAISSTTEKNADLLINNNYEYTKLLALYCLKNKIRFIYASSAATYGDGSLGFDDNEETIRHLRPLNMYGYSKQLFDLWAVRNKSINKIAGLKYFNVYGPNEYHKGEMRSVVHKAFEQIRDTGKIRLFKSENPQYRDGEQKRDFVFLKDAVDMTLFFLDNREVNGLFNIGSGQARTWNDLAASIFHVLGKKINIEYIPMPPDIAGKYQYFTEAGLSKIKKAGYTQSLHTLEEGITDYVQNYLLKEKFLTWDK